MFTNTESHGNNKTHKDVVSYRLAIKAGLNGMVHGLSWIGWLPKLLHVKLCVSWFELKWTAAFNHSLAMYHGTSTHDK